MTNTFLYVSKWINFCAIFYYYHKNKQIANKNKQMANNMHYYNGFWNKKSLGIK